MIEKRLPEEKQNSPCVYFLRNLQTKLPAPADAAEARRTIPRYVEYGVLNAHSLMMLHQLMENIFVPYLNTKSASEEERDPNQTKPSYEKYSEYTYKIRAKKPFF